MTSRSPVVRRGRRRWLVQGSAASIAALLVLACAPLAGASNNHYQLAGSRWDHTDYSEAGIVYETLSTSVQFSGGQQVRLAGDTTGDGQEQCTPSGYCGNLWISDGVHVTVTHEDGTVAEADSDEWNVICLGLYPSGPMDLSGLMAPGRNQISLQLREECGSHQGHSPLYLIGDATLGPPTTEDPPADGGSGGDSGPVFEQIPTGEVIGTTAPLGTAFTVSATDPGGGLVHLAWTPDTIWDGWPVRVSCRPAQPTVPAARATVTCVARNVAVDLHLTGVWAPSTTMVFVATNARGSATSRVVDIGEGDSLNAPPGVPQGPSDPGPSPPTRSAPSHDTSQEHVSSSSSASSGWVLTTNGYWEREQDYWGDLGNGADACVESAGSPQVAEACELVAVVAHVGETVIVVGRAIGGLVHEARAAASTRPTYTTVAKPEDPKLPALSHATGQHRRAFAAIYRMARNLARADGLSSALMTSLGRMRAAATAGDGAAERRQSTAAHRYAARLAVVEARQHRLGAEAVEVLKAMGIKRIPVRARWAAFQREVRRHGLPKRIAEHLTAGQRAQARLRILATPRSRVVRDFYTAMDGSAFRKQTDASVAALEQYAASPIT